MKPILQEEHIMNGQEKIQEMGRLTRAWEDLELSEADRIELVTPFFNLFNPLTLTLLSTTPSFNDGDPCTATLHKTLYMSFDPERAEILEAYYLDPDSDYAPEPHEDDDPIEYDVSTFNVEDILKELGIETEEGIVSLLAIYFQSLQMALDCRMYPTDTRFTYSRLEDGSLAELQDSYHNGY